MCSLDDMIKKVQQWLQGTLLQAIVTQLCRVPPSTWTFIIRRSDALHYSSPRTVSPLVRVLQLSVPPSTD